MNQKTHAQDQDVDFFIQCLQLCRSAMDQLCRCRECRSHCSPLSSICETCGTQDPVRLPWKWTVLAGVTCVALLVIGVWIT